MQTGDIFIKRPAKVKTDKIFMGNCFWRFLKNQDLSDKNFVINFLKSPLELHFTHVSDFCRIFIFIKKRFPAKDGYKKFVMPHK